MKATRIQSPWSKCEIQCEEGQDGRYGKWSRSETYLLGIQGETVGILIWYRIIVYPRLSCQSKLIHQGEPMVRLAGRNPYGVSPESHGFEQSQWGF